MVKEILNFVAGFGTALAWSSPKVCYGTRPAIYASWLVASAGFVVLSLNDRAPAGLARELQTAAVFAWIAAFVHILIRYVQKRRGSLPWPPPEESKR